MKGKFVLVSGSASYSCPQTKLGTALEFLRCFTREVLIRGGGLVVLGSDEDSTKDDHGTPHIFDWIVLREVEEYSETTTEPPRLYAFIVMSEEAVEAKISDANLRLLKNLEQRNVVELHYLRREKFTGGEYRKAQVQSADAMLAIGGGKGTYSAGIDMTDIGKPVLPLDLRIGSFSNDGDGAVALHRELMLTPSRFFFNTHRDTMNKIGLVNLNRGINQAATAARAAVEMIGREFDTAPQATWRMRAKRRLVSAWQFTRALPVVSAIIKIIESILRFGG